MTCAACSIACTSHPADAPTRAMGPPPPRPTLHLGAAQVQTMTPRASDALAVDTACALLDFEWQELERALQELSGQQARALVDAVHAQLPRESCRGQRQAILVLAGVSARDREALITSLPAWYPQRAGEALSAASLLQTEPNARAPLVEFTRACGDVARYGAKPLSAGEWPAMLRGLRSLTSFESRHAVPTDKCAVLLGMRAPDRDRAVRSALRLLPSSYPLLQKETDSQGHYLRTLLTSLGSVPIEPRQTILRHATSRYNARRHLPARSRSIAEACAGASGPGLRAAR